jgi:tRNA threonylcarbamoyladenosine biosynthesis protein TsaB
VELVGVSSLRALAANAVGRPFAELMLEEPARGPLEVPRGVLAVLDARRGEVFLAVYSPSASRTTPSGARELLGARAIAPAGLEGAIDAITGQAPATEAIAGDGGEPGGSWLAIGDGAIRYREHLVRAGALVPPDDSALHRISATAICDLGAAGGPAVGYQQIEPDYGRRPDAEIALEAVSP